MAERISILGSGSMATALSVVLTDTAERDVVIWGHDPEHVREIQAAGENRRLLPGISLSGNVRLTSDVEEAAHGADLLVAAIPSKFLRNALQPFQAAVPSGLPVVSVVKGIENETFLRPSEIVRQVLGRRPVVVLSGPSHAEEFARRKPCSVVAASDDTGVAERVQRIFTTDRFRVYTNPDVVGVELAGALKNVMAIAAGISDGLGYGDNAKAALVSRGLVETIRFGEAFGAEAGTFGGLAGVGDLVVTCFSGHSRNRRVGERLGRGESLADVESSTDSVAEGVSTTRSVHDVAAREGVDMPITAEVHRVLFEGRSPHEATDALMLRPLKEE